MSPAADDESDQPSTAGHVATVVLVGRLTRRAAWAAGAVLALMGVSAASASAVAAPAELSLLPGSHQFGSVPLREHRDLSLTVSNIGGRASSGVTVTLTGSSEYAVTSDTCSGHTLGPGKTCVVDVRFAPMVDGVANASVTVTGKHRVAPVTATLTGRGGGLGTGAPESLYWTSLNADFSNSIDKSPLTANPLTVTTVIPALPAAPNSLAVDGKNAYWTDLSDFPNGKLNATPLDGGPATTLVGNLNGPQGVAVADGDVYWAEFGDGSVKRISLSTGAVTTLVAGQVGVLNVAADSQNVYWTTETGSPTGGAIRYAPLTATGAGPAAVLVDGLDSPGGLAVEDNRVYWTDAATGTVSALSLAGGTATMIAAGQSGPGSIAVSGGTAFWVTGDPAINTAPADGGAAPTTVYSSTFDTPTYLAIGP